MQDIMELSGFLKALSDPTRLRIIEYLSRAGNPRCVGAISKHINVSQSAISQHLRILRQANLVKSERRGYHIHYEVNEEILNDNLSKLRDFLKK
ncbi:MAG: ArsR/SmtB family transcription factor [Bacteroidales bacterium]